MVCHGEHVGALRFAGDLAVGESQPVNYGPTAAPADAWVRLDRGSRVAVTLGVQHRVHPAVLSADFEKGLRNDFQISV